MTQKSIRHGKSILSGRNVIGTKIGTPIGAHKKHIAAQIKKDIER